MGYDSCPGNHEFDYTLTASPQPQRRGAKRDTLPAYVMSKSRAGTDSNPKRCAPR
jgi:hypothetical protein